MTERRIELSSHDIHPDDFPLTVEFWAASADRRLAPTWKATISEPGVLRVPGIGPGTWTRLTMGTGDVFIEPPPGQREEDF